MQNQNSPQPFKVVIDPLLINQLRAYQAQIPFIKDEIKLAKSVGLDTTQFEADLAKAEAQANQILKVYGNRV